MFNSPSFLWTLLKLRNLSSFNAGGNGSQGGRRGDAFSFSVYGLSRRAPAGPQNSWWNMWHQTQEGQVKIHSEQGFSPLGASLSHQFTWTCFIIFTPLRNARSNNCNSKKRRKEVFSNIKREARWGQCILHYLLLQREEKDWAKRISYIPHVSRATPSLWRSQRTRTQWGHGGGWGLTFCSKPSWSLYILFRWLNVNAWRTEESVRRGPKAHVIPGRCTWNSLALSERFSRI